MTTRTKAPLGAPCWADLWTSDVGGARRFYGELFGWDADEPQPQFGGYFLFRRDGVEIAGGMGDMPDMPAQNRWSVYLATDDTAKTLEAAAAAGAQIESPAMAVTDLGVQGILTDPTGAHLGAWQAGTFAGFTVLDEPAAPSWFELHTRDYARAVDFYRSAFRWETAEMPPGPDMSYTTQVTPGSGEPLAGILDAAGFLPEDVPSTWFVYWQVGDVDNAVAQVEALGGSLLSGPETTPYGRIASVADPTGAQFKLRAS